VIFNRFIKVPFFFWFVEHVAGHVKEPLQLLGCGNKTAPQLPVDPDALYFCFNGWWFWQVLRLD